LGLIPTSEKINQETAESLTQKLHERIAVLSERCSLSNEELRHRSLLTPSCGTGTLAPDLADKVLELLAKVSSPVSTNVG
jgi:hypothetical protein